MENWSTVLLDQGNGDRLIGRRVGHIVVASNTVIRLGGKFWVALQTVVNADENVTIILLAEARESQAKEFAVVVNAARAS
jgi:hypothetical protein